MSISCAVKADSSSYSQNEQLSSSTDGQKDHDHEQQQPQPQRRKMSSPGTGFVHSATFSSSMSTLGNSDPPSPSLKSDQNNDESNTSNKDDNNKPNCENSSNQDNNNPADPSTTSEGNNNATANNNNNNNKFQNLTLLQAVTNGDVRKVRRMVVKGVPTREANERDPQGRTPLSYACGNGMVLTVEFLSFIPDLDPNKQDNEGNTPLILAAQAGHVDCIRILLKEFRNVRLDHQNRKGYTALIQAAINGRTDCAKILMESGANPFFHDKVRKKNALQWAEFCGRTPCAAAIREMTGRFPAVVRHLVQAGQSVLTRHRSIWGSDTEIDRIAEREKMAAKGEGATAERRGTISRLLQRSAKWIRSLSKRRSNKSYKSLGALVSVSLAISGPAVSRQMLHNPEEENKAPNQKVIKRRASAKTKSHHHHGPQSPTFRIPEVQIIAPLDDFGGRVSGAIPTVVKPPPSGDSDCEGCSVCSGSVVAAPASSTATGSTGATSSSSSSYNREARGQASSAPTSPVLSSRSADRAHRKRFAQRSQATTSRQQPAYHSPSPTAFAYHSDAIAAIEHFHAVAHQEHPSDGSDNDLHGAGYTGDDSSIEEEEEELFDQTTDDNIVQYLNENPITKKPY